MRDFSPSAQQLPGDGLPRDAVPMRRVAHRMPTGSVDARGRTSVGAQPKRTAFGAFESRNVRPGLLRAFVLLFIAATAAFLVVGAAAWLKASDTLVVQSIEITTDGDLAAAELLSYAGITKGAPLLATRPTDIAERLREHPFVATAQVRVVPPGTVSIAVTERKAHAVLIADGLYLVDGNGDVFKGARVGDGLNLPVIRGFDHAALNASSAESPLAASGLAQAVALVKLFASVQVPGGGLSEVIALNPAGPAVRFMVVLSDGTEAVLGSGAFPEKVARLAAVVNELARAGHRASSIYLDDERRPERAGVRLRSPVETQTAGG